ncbi:MAG: substrate-binding domain-containing protein [Nitrospirae bacterium]|nr:substrate-binding domain-containing protein [Nitrospirota bacterium]
MKRNIIITAAVVAFLVTLNLSAFADEIKLAGGGTVESTVITPIKAAFEKATGHKITFLKVGSKNAFGELLKGNVEAATADVGFNDLMEIAKKEKMDAGDPASYQHVVIAKDKLIFFTNKDNVVTKLSKDQLKGIITGKVQNWKEVGGKDMPTIVVWGKLSTGTNSMVSKNILDGEPQAKDVIEVNSSDDVKAMVISTPEGIGFGPIAMRDDKIKSPETPEVARPLILVTKGAPSANVQKLIDFVKGEGQKYIK